MSVKEKDGCEFYEYVKGVVLKNGFKHMTAFKVAVGMDGYQMSKFKEFGIISTNLITRMCEVCLALNKEDMLQKKAECDARMFQQEQDDEAAKLEQYHKDMAKKRIEKEQKAKANKVAKLEAAQAKKVAKENEANYKTWCNEVNKIIDEKIKDVKVVGIIELMRHELEQIKENTGDVDAANDSLENLEFGCRWLKEFMEARA